MLRIFIFSLLFFSPAVLFSDEKKKNEINVYQVGDYFVPYKLQTQHKKPHTMSPETKVILLSFEMSLSKRIHQWLSTKDKNYLKEHLTEYVADISDMPDIITFLFAGPKMRGYDFPIIWARTDDFDLKYPKKEEKITVIELDENGIIKKISFLKSMKEVESKIYKKDLLPPPVVTDQTAEETNLQ